MSSRATQRIQLGHGSGGRLTHRLIRDLFVRHLSNPILDPLDDAALIALASGDPEARLAFTTDSFVVSPLCFPGGDIGSLAINGTVNDLAVSGAVPGHLTLAAILEEGLEIELLEGVVRSAARAAQEAGVTVVSGDTKVVERGKGDALFLNTSGVGLVRPGYPRPDRCCAAGDKVLVSGPVGDHGAVVLAARSDIGLVEGTLQSDCAPVTPLVEALFEAGTIPLFMRDPTRGGLAGVLCDLAELAGLEVRVSEAEIAIRPEVTTICDILGVDPLHLACEGRVVALVPERETDRALAAWRALPQGERATCVGELALGTAGRVSLTTLYGGARIVARPTAELLPRIC